MEPRYVAVLSIDGNAACALVGPNLQEGTAEFVNVPLKPEEPGYMAAAYLAAGRALVHLEEKLGCTVGVDLGYVLGEGLANRRVGLPLSLTRAQADEFLNKAFGFRSLGVAEGEEVAEAWCSPLRSFALGVLGKQPATYCGLTPPDTRVATAALLRAVADVLDPPGAP